MVEPPLDAGWGDATTAAVPSTGCAGVRSADKAVMPPCACACACDGGTTNGVIANIGRPFLPGEMCVPSAPTATTAARCKLGPPSVATDEGGPTLDAVGACG